MLAFRAPPPTFPPFALTKHTQKHLKQEQNWRTIVRSYVWVFQSCVCPAKQNFYGKLYNRRWGVGKISFTRCFGCDLAPGCYPRPRPLASCVQLDSCLGFTSTQQTLKTNLKFFSLRETLGNIPFLQSSLQISIEWFWSDLGG